MQPVVVDALRSSDFWLRIQDVAFRPGDANAPLAGAILSRIPDGCFASKHALDLGCGTGSFARELLSVGRATGQLERVTAVDLCAQFIEQAQAEPSDVVFQCDDVFEYLKRLERPTASLITMVFSTLVGYSPSRDVELLSLVREALEPGGVIVVDFPIRSFVPTLARTFVGRGFELTRAIDDAGYTNFDYDFGDEVVRLHALIHDADSLHRLGAECGLSVSTEEAVVGGQPRLLGFFRES